MNPTPPTRIPLTVAARDEACAIGPCLDSLLAAVACAEARLPLRFDVQVVLDDCTDDTEAIARRRPVAILHSSGGKVEAQRSGARPDAPFCIFSDADISVDEDTLAALCHAMLADPAQKVAYPPKRPLPPARHGALAEAIYVYNLHRGFARDEAWFSGKLFAIRAWSIPTLSELATRLAALPPDPFLQLHRGILLDDVYLSRTLVHAHGPAALRETERGRVYFRAPETLRGMYRYYRRLQMELERMDRLFPETRPTHARHGVRITDPTAVARATPRERRLFLLFRLAVAACRMTYIAERAYHRLRRSPPWQDFPPIVETKRPIHRAGVQSTCVIHGRT